MQAATSLKERGAKERGAKVRFPPPLVFVFLIAASMAFGRLVLPLELSIDRTIRIATGALVVVCGVGLIASARIHFLRTKQHPAPWLPSPELILGGPFRFIRNPMYLGMTTIMTGAGVVSNNLWTVAVAPVALVIVHFLAVLPEEKYLSEKFGESYQRYRSKVGRYLPF